MKVRLSIILITVGLLSVLMYPTSEPKMVNRTWTIVDSKAYAKDGVIAWGEQQWYCLNKLWSKESNWRTMAYNPIKVMGKHAAGIPQLLGMKRTTPPTEQIDRGLSYIFSRYGTPCAAWQHERRHNWY